MSGSAPSLPLLDELRRQTKEAHHQLELSPFTRALASGDLALESFVGMLKATAIVRTVLENSLDGTSSPDVAAVWTEPLRRSALLESDIRFFSVRNLPDIPDALAAARSMAEKIRVRSDRDPNSLLGSLYVLEGSMKGAPVLRRLAARSFDFKNDDGLRYLLSGENAPSAWDDFSRRMNALVVSGSIKDGIVAAAREMFDGLASLFRALHPISRVTRQNLAVSLNPEAGQHPIPSDPRELDAASRAGVICWKQFPYLEMRYADRGRRFTSSDSAWLVTLSDSDQATVNQQVLWLGRVLSSRGLPRLILESQLKILHAELKEAVPEKRQVYDRLLTASQMLGEVRTERMGENRFKTLADNFTLRVGGNAAPLLNVGPLIASAVSDEKEGISGAVTSIVGWLTDPGRFSPDWIQAVALSVQEARSSVA